MEKYSGNQKGFIYASCDTKDQEIVFDKYLEPLAHDGISFCWGDRFDKKEEDNIARSNAVLLFLTNDFARDDRLRKTVEAAVRNDKPLLTVYLENVDLDAGLSMQLESQQALFISYYDSEEEFIEALKKAAIFDKIEVTEQQKKKQKSRTIAAIAAAVIVLIAAVIIIKPLLTPKANAETMEALGLQGLSKEELENVTELHIVGNEVVDYTAERTHYDEDDRSKIMYSTPDGEWLSTTQGTIIDLAGLEQLKNLRVLQIEGQQIEDITPILELENLEELYLSCNPLSSIDGVEKLGKLRRLSISSTNVTELPEDLAIAEIIDLDTQGSIPDFKGAEDVVFRGNYNDFSDYSSLGNAASYEELAIESDGHDAEILELLNDIPIKNLHLIGLQINSLEDLSGLDVSETLDICHSSISSLDGIEHFEGITTMDLKYCTNLTDLTPVNKLKSLKTLIISDELVYMADQVDDRIEIKIENN